MRSYRGGPAALRHRPVNCRTRPPPVLPPTSLGLKNSVIDAAAAANQRPPRRGRVPECDVYARGGPMGARRGGRGVGLEERGKTILNRPDRAAAGDPAGGGGGKTENFACRVESSRVGSSRDNPDKCIKLLQFALKPIESWFSFFSLHSPPALKRKKKKKKNGFQIHFGEVSGRDEGRRRRRGGLQLPGGPLRAPRRPGPHGGEERPRDAGVHARARPLQIRNGRQLGGGEKWKNPRGRERTGSGCSDNVRRGKSK